MINRLNFEGYIEKIIFKNAQVLKFTVTNTCEGRNKRITATVFNSYNTKELFEQVEHLIGKLVVVVGELYEANYRDKKTNEWINNYCVQVEQLIER